MTSIVAKGKVDFVVVTVEPEIAGQVAQPRKIADGDGDDDAGEDQCRANDDQDSAEIFHIALFKIVSAAGLSAESPLSGKAMPRWA